MSRSSWGRTRSCAFLVALMLLLGSAPGVFAQGEQTYVLRILHTNDHHAHLEPVTVGNATFGGIARRKTLIDKLRSEGGNQLLLDAGDVFQGTLYFNKYKGQADLYFYNQLKYDAMAVGNHEFDDGQQTLADFINGAQFPVLSANIVADASTPLAGKIKPYIIKTVGGQKIGIFGLTTEETPILSSPGKGVTFTDHVAAAQKAVADLEAQGVNKIIALTHEGFNVDQLLAGQVNGIDIIVGGHSHTPLDGQPGSVGDYPTLETTPNGQKVVVVQDWEWGKWLGDISVGFNDKGEVTNWQGKPIPVDESVREDAGFAAKVKEYAAPLEQLKATPVGVTNVRLNGDRADVRSKETNLGDLIADAMLDKARQNGAQLAITNGGGIRSSIEQGEVTVGEVLEVLPFGNTLAVVTINGDQVKQALENGVSQVEQGAGRFPQVAGLRFTYNPAAPAGNRVVSVEVAADGGFKPIDPNASYRVVTNNFMLTGGDGYVPFTQGTNPVDTGFILADVVQDYIGAHSPVNATTDNRIQEGTSASAPAPAPSQPAPSPGTPAPSPMPSPVTPPAGQVPVTLPNTGGEMVPIELLLALAAASVAGGAVVRRVVR